MNPIDNTQTTRGASTVVGLFRDETQAERAIRDLKAAGFSEGQIGVMMQDEDAQRRLATETGTKAGEGAATGAVSGGVLGGIVGLLAGVGALVIPGIGPIIAGGALASTLAGAGIGAAAGGLIGALIGMGIPEEDARYYDSGLREGGILVTVDAGADADRARRILIDSGAQFGPATTSTFEAEDQKRLQLREEELVATKQRVQAGEVRVRKDIVTEERTIQVPVTREEVVIERHPVSGQAASGDIKDGEEIRIPLSEEEVRVEKRPVVKEEITVSKRQRQETETVRDTVRREEARIEEAGTSRARGRWEGKERRRRYDNSYAGPERRTVTA